MRTYFSNPFLVGSDKAGKYDFQNFNLSAQVAQIIVERYSESPSVEIYGSYMSLERCYAYLLQQPFPSGI